MDDLFLRMIDEQLKGGSDFRPFVVGELLKEVRRLRALTEWRPIESAPEGQKVILWWPHWDDLPFDGYFADGRWYAENVLSSEGPGPTHWPHLATGKPCPSRPCLVRIPGGDLKP